MSNLLMKIPNHTFIWNSKFMRMSRVVVISELCLIILKIAAHFVFIYVEINLRILLMNKKPLVNIKIFCASTLK